MMLHLIQPFYNLIKKIAILSSKTYSCFKKSIFSHLLSLYRSLCLKKALNPFQFFLNSTLVPL